MKVRRQRCQSIADDMPVNWMAFLLKSLKTVCLRIPRRSLTLRGTALTVRDRIQTDPDQGYRRMQELAQVVELVDTLS